MWWYLEAEFWKVIGQEGIALMRALVPAMFECLCPQNSYVEDLFPEVMVWKVESFGWLGCEGGALIVRISALEEKTHRIP